MTITSCPLCSFTDTEVPSDRSYIRIPLTSDLGFAKSAAWKCATSGSRSSINSPGAVRFLDRNTISQAIPSKNATSTANIPEGNTGELRLGWRFQVSVAVRTKTSSREGRSQSERNSPMVAPRRASAISVPPVIKNVAANKSVRNGIHYFPSLIFSRMSNWNFWARFSSAFPGRRSPLSLAAA